MGFLNKRLIAALIIVFMLITLIAGCSPADTTAPATTTTTAAQTTDADDDDDDSDVTEETTTAAEEVDIVEIRMTLPLFAQTPDMDNEDWWTMHEEASSSKLDIEWVPIGDWTTKFDLTLVSGDLPEVIAGLDQASPTLVNAIRGGAFWDLTDKLGDFSDYPNIYENTTPGAFSFVSVDGKIWGLPRNRPTIDGCILFRKDWLDLYGIDVPTTTDEFHQALKTIVEEDPSGQGTIGMITEGAWQLAMAFGVHDVVYDDAGGLIHGNVSTQYADYIEFLSQLYADDIMIHEFTAVAGTQMEEMFVSGRGAAYERNIWRAYFFQDQIHRVQPEAEVIALPPLKGPNGHYSVKLERGMYGALYLAASTAEDKLMDILDYFERTNTEEYLIWNFYGFEGVHHEVVDGQRVMTEQGLQEVTTSQNQVVMLSYNEWTKVVYPGAPKEYNDNMLEEVQIYLETGRKIPFEVMISDTWTDIWPNNVSEWQTKRAQAIMGQISINDYRSYLEGLRNQDDFKQAFQEYTAAYEVMFG